MSGTPVEDLGFLSDCRTTALVDRDGSVQWLCFPDVDSPSVFGLLLDDAAGYCTVAPTAAYDSDRQYRDGTLILDTTFRTDSGTVVLTDALAFGEGVRRPRRTVRRAVGSPSAVPGSWVRWPGSHSTPRGSHRA